MLPQLFTAFGHPVSTYGVMLSLAHLVGIALVLRTVRASRLGTWKVSSGMMPRCSGDTQ